MRSAGRSTLRTSLQSVETTASHGVRLDRVYAVIAHGCWYAIEPMLFLGGRANLHVQPNRSYAESCQSQPQRMRDTPQCSTWKSTPSKCLTSSITHDGGGEVSGAGQIANLQPGRASESARVGLRSPAHAWWPSHVSELAATAHRVVSTDSGDRRVFVAVTKTCRLTQTVRAEV
jgi:hypothetical protein